MAEPAKMDTLRMSQNHRGILGTIGTIYNTQAPHPQKGGEYTVAGAVSLPVTAERIKQLIVDLIEAGELVPRLIATTNEMGFTTDTWEGWPRHGVMSPEENEQMAAKTKEKTEAKKAPRAKKRAASLEGMSAEDFFQENAKKKVVFKPGFDAKFASMLKRIANGNGDSDDKRLLKSKKLVEHDKVVNSEHLMALVREANVAA